MSGVDKETTEAFPLDVVIIGSLTVVTGLFVFVPPLNRSVLRSIFAFLFIFFAPGYTIVAILLPDSELLDDVGVASRYTSHLLERCVFGFGISVALTILIGLTLGRNPGGLTQTSVFITLGLITVLGLPIAILRQTSDATNIKTALVSTITRFWDLISNQLTTPRSVLTGVVILVFVFGIISAGVDAGGQQDGDITEMYLLSENSDGEFTASNYPSSIEIGESEPFVVGFSNHEGETIEYSLIVVLQEFEEGTDTGTVASQLELLRYDRTLSDGENTTIQHDINVAGTNVEPGENYRLTYLLYIDDPSGPPSVETAHREVHLWLRIEGGS